MAKDTIKLMPDYYCSPLWYDGGEKIGNIDPRDIGVSERLTSELESWASTFDSHLDLSDPESTTWTEEEETDFNAKGRILYNALVAEIGGRFTIHYREFYSPKNRA